MVAAALWTSASDSSGPRRRRIAASEQRGDAVSIAADLLADFDEEVANTRRMLEAIPDGRRDWKPHAKSMSLGQLAGHHVIHHRGQLTFYLRLLGAPVLPTYGPTADMPMG